jgi:hypothetical protein
VSRFFPALFQRVDIVRDKIIFYKNPCEREHQIGGDSG